MLVFSFSYPFLSYFSPFSVPPFSSPHSLLSYVYSPHYYSSSYLLNSLYMPDVGLRAPLTAQVTFFLLSAISSSLLGLSASTFKLICLLYFKSQLEVPTNIHNIHIYHLQIKSLQDYHALLFSSFP